mgnify:CR=1 FL=1
MSSFIFGFIMGAVCMFFAIGWLWMRMVEQVEPISPSKPSEDIAAGPRLTSKRFKTPSTMSALRA